ncbi:uncharacterized protein LOC108739014 [Agrilus planipennis]|uniref:Uncharacterized protein LOC108739014 n=1 Tax=Agrilus planipennis TaxID=224129 RepID=A0A1W4X708_AGRPL|nr:uncharacterized protein LOC108739014 [Agrilus planipennis]
METLSGYNILHTFQELGIDTGNITKNVFEAWFDTDDIGTISFLNWFCSLNKENVLKSSEYEEFLHLKHNHLIIEGEEYEQAIKDIQMEYDEIWNCDSNCFEIECLNDELDALHEEQQAQENVCKLQDTLSKDLLKQIASEKENELQLMIIYKTAQEKCLQLSNHLDEIHEKIHMQIYKYSDIINNFKNVQAFISNIPWTNYNQCSHEVSSSLNCYINKEYDSNKCIGTTRKSVKRIGENYSFLTKSSLEELDDLHLCISKVIKNLITNSIEESKLRAELKYLKTLNLYEAISYFCDSESIQFMLEDNIATKEERLAQILSQIEQASNEVASKLTNEAKINRFKKQLERNEKKLNYAKTKINDKFLDILTNQELCLLLLKKEKHFMETTGQFFRDISQYVINNMQSCQKRIEIMIDVILQSNDFRQLPVEHKCTLISSIASILLNGKNDKNNPIKVIADFKKNTSLLHYNLFKNDNVNHLKSFEYIYKEISLLKSFLMSSPTTCIVVIPPELFSALREVKLNLENQKKAVAKGLEIYNHNTNILNKNKWLRLKRQLWLYFLSEPRKVLSVIEELKKEIESGSAI